jgi:uncharacterized protein YggE
MTIKKDIKNTNESKKILELNSLLKFVSILFILSATILAISKISLDGEGDKGFNQNTITVSGHSEISVKPDTTKFTITVAESAKDIKSSQDAATNKINAAIVILKQNGVLDKNIKTLNFNTYPKYSSRTTSCVTAPTSPVKGKVITPVVKAAATNSDAKEVSAPVAPASAKVVASKVSVAVVSAPSNSPCVDRTSEIVGYETSQSIEVKITDISKNPDLAGALVAAVGKVGVTVGELTSFVDNVDKTKQSIRNQAIQKAKVQAQDIAESLGVRLGKITSFSENVGDGYPYPMMMSAKMVEVTDSASVNLPVGEDKITSDVSITYSIK